MNNIKEIEISLLGFLYNTPKHGYDLHKDISDLSGTGIVWKVKMGKLYAMLHRLEKNGWIKPKTTQEGNRPQRIQYSITADGKQIFDEWVLTPIQHGRDFRILFLLKLFFAIDIDHLAAQKLLNEQTVICEQWNNIFLDNMEEDKGKKDFNSVVINFRISQINGYLDWLKWCKNNIVGEEI